MLSTRDLHLIFLYEYKLKHNAAQATKNINSAFKKDTANDRNVCRWFTKFHPGNFNLKIEPRMIRQIFVNEENLRDIIENNPQTTFRKLVTDFKVSAMIIS